MGLSLSLLSLSWIELVRKRVFGLKEVEADLINILVSVRKIKMALRSLSFKRSNSGTRMRPAALVIDRSLSFKNWELAEEIKHESTISSLNMQSTDGSGQDSITFKSMDGDAIPEMKISYSVSKFCSP